MLVSRRLVSSPDRFFPFLFGDGGKKENGNKRSGGETTRRPPLYVLRAGGARLVMCMS